MTRRRLPYLLVALFALLGGRAHHGHVLYGHRPRALPHAALGSTRVIEMPASTTTTEPAPSTTTAAAPESPEQAWLSSPTARCVIHAESRGDGAWSNVSVDGARGLWQIEPETWLTGASWAQVNPEDHTIATQDAVAYALWEHLGWGPWRGDGCE